MFQQFIHRVDVGGGAIQKPGPEWYLSWSTHQLFHPQHQGKLSSAVPARSPNAVASQGQGQLSCSSVHRLSRLCPCHQDQPYCTVRARALTLGKQNPLSPMLQQESGWTSSSTPTSLGLAHLQPWQPGPVLLCCPGQVQGLTSQVLQQVRDRASSPVLMTPGPALPPAVGGKGQRGWRASLPCPSHCPAPK